MHYPLFIFTIFLSLSSLAQQGKEKKGVKLAARVLPDSILLRWAPTDPQTWALGNKYGYLIERYSLGENKIPKNVPTLVVLNPQPLRPLPLAQWEPVAKANKYGAIAAQAIYGESFEIANAKKQENQSLIRQAYEKSTEMEMRFSFALLGADLDANTAKAAGLKWTDKSIKKGSRYLYKVYVAVPENLDIRLDTGTVFLSTDEYIPLPKPLEFLATFSDTTVVLTWNQKLLQGTYVAYDIERSRDGGLTFQKRNKEPFIAINERKENDYVMFLDTVHTRKQLLYRIRGWSSFGEKGPYSALQKGFCKPLVRQAPEAVAAQVIGKDVRLTWKYDKANLPNIVGYKVYRSMEITSSYKAVSLQLAPTVLSFKDPKPITAAYYKVCAVDAKGNEKESLPILVQLEDDEAPSTPRMVTGTIDRNGWAKVEWQPNREGDLWGYYVYKSNHRQQEASKVTPKHLNASTFSEKLDLRSLTDSVYYYLTAVDGHNNESKPFVLALRKPDLLPPAPVLIKKTIATSKGIYLMWANSASKDAQSYKIVRFSQQVPKGILVANLPHSGDTTAYLDTRLEEGEQYHYTVAAIDESGLSSEPFPSLKVRSLRASRTTTFTTLLAIRDTSINEVQLSWQSDGSPVKHWIIYRGSQGERLAQYESSETNVFIDVEIQRKKNYYYHVRPVYHNDELGPISQRIEETRKY